MERKELEKWVKVLDDAISFLEDTLACFLWVDYGAGKMDSIFLKNLKKDQLTEYNRLKEILGESGIAYLASIDCFSIPPNDKDAEVIEEEYRRIKSLTRDQFHQEVEKEIKTWKEE